MGSTKKFMVYSKIHNATIQKLRVLVKKKQKKKKKLVNICMD